MSDPENNADDAEGTRGNVNPGKRGRGGGPPKDAPKAGKPNDKGDQAKGKGSK